MEAEVTADSIESEEFQFLKVDIDDDLEHGLGFGVWGSGFSF